MRYCVAFDAPTTSRNETGGEKTGFEQAFLRSAAFTYVRAREGVQDEVRTGTITYKVRIHQSTAARAITTDYRMRDVRNEIFYQILEVDAYSDRDWIWLEVQSGVAVGAD